MIRITNFKTTLKSRLINNPENKDLCLYLLAVLNVPGNVTTEEDLEILLEVTKDHFSHREEVLMDLGLIEDTITNESNLELLRFFIRD